MGLPLQAQTPDLCELQLFSTRGLCKRKGTRCQLHLSICKDLKLSVYHLRASKTDVQSSFQHKTQGQVFAEGYFETNQDEL